MSAKRWCSFTSKRHYCVSAWAVTAVLIFLIFLITLNTLFTPRAFANDADGSPKIFSPDAGRVNLYKTLKFEAYKASGTDEERKAAEERLASIEPAAFFIEGVKKIEERITVLVIGAMYCLDGKAVYPYVEAMQTANTFISTRYLVYTSTPGAREFMVSRTGLAATPSIFIVRPGKEGSNRNGEVLNRSYVEAPSRVIALLEAAKNEEESDVIWKDLHSGVYDEDIQRDLLELIMNLWN